MQCVAVDPLRMDAPRVVNQIGSQRRCSVEGHMVLFESTRLDPLAWNSLDLEPKTVWEDENVLPINRNMRIDPHRIDILDRVFNAETERSGWVRSFWYSTGTTATTTKPTTCFETPPTGSKVRRRTIPAQFQVDVVMKRYDWYAVVVPCRGLWWIPCDNLTLNHPPKRARVVKRRRRTIPEISPDDFALSVVYNSSIRMASLVRLMNGAQLTSLCLAGNLKYEELTDVLQSCPRLRALGLRGTLISSQAIVHGYRDGFCRLEALSVFPGWPFYPRELLEPLVNMLCDSKHPGTNCLRTFNFASDDPALIDRLMTANTWLENVHVVWLTPTASPYISQRLMKWHGRQLSRPRPTWLPFLSVASRHLGLSPRLLGANSHSARSRLDEPLLRTILAFASDHRHMMWTRAEFVAQEGWPRLWL